MPDTTRREPMMITPSPSIDYLQYPNIYAQREIATGKRLVIIAEAEKGDYNTPILISSKDMAYDNFGGGKLVQSYEDATTFQEGLSIYLMRLEPYGYETAFLVLEAFSFDLLFINEIHFNKDKEVIDMFLEFAKTKEETGNLIHGIVSLSEDIMPKDLDSIVEDIRTLTDEYGDETIENGKYLSVVLNQIKLKDTGAVYAGILTSIDVETSPINKTIPDISLLYELEKVEILNCRSGGIVCFKSTFKKGVTCTSSSCAVGTNGSVHQHISNFRIAQSLINQVAVELQPHVGMPNPIFQAQNINSILDAICMEFMNLKRIRDYVYHVGVQETSGIIDIEIECVPIFSVHAMTTHSRVRIFK
jgi:hypothetical protein